MRRYLPWIIVVLVGVLAVGGGVALYQIKRPRVLTTTTENIANTAGESLHIRGNPNAAVTLEEFGDYQCPPCAILAEPLNQLEREFDKKLRLIFYNFPLINHQHARAAAHAAEAAGLQGKFWEMHDLIYKEQKTWSKATEVKSMFVSYAGILGLDLERFKTDMESETVKSKVEADQKRGTSIGVQNTPTLFLNNRAVPATEMAPDRLRAAVEAAVKAADSPSPQSSKK